MKTCDLTTVVVDSGSAARAQARFARICNNSFGTPARPTAAAEPNRSAGILIMILCEKRFFGLHQTASRY
jgi:hypothetical protein